VGLKLGADASRSSVESMLGWRGCRTPSESSSSIVGEVGTKASCRCVCRLLVRMYDSGQLGAENCGFACSV